MGLEPVEILRVLAFFLIGLGGTACTATVSHDSEPLQQTFESDLPAWLDEDARRAVVMVYDPLATQLSTAIVIGTDLLLTAAHAVDDFDVNENGWASTQVAGQDSRVRIIEQGEFGQAHGDWAILQVEHADFEPVAHLHAAAFDPNWAPQLGTQVALVGYAAGFFPTHEVDVGEPSPGITTMVAQAPTNERGAGIWYTSGGVRDLGGLSGGAAFILSPQSGRPEVIGVFTSQLRTRMADHEVMRFLGIPLRHTRIERDGLLYDIQRLPGQLVDWTADSDKAAQ